MSNHDMNFAQITLLIKGEMKSDYICQPVCIFWFHPKTIQLAFMHARGEENIGEEAKQAE